jgi:glycosyltransferase involved in cell wall biosynthesis
MAVVAPIPWGPPLTETAGRARAVPRISDEAGIVVVRPRLPSIPIGGRFIEHRLWGLRLLPVLRMVCEEISGEIVHAHFALPDGFAAAEFAVRAHVPFILTVRGDDLLVFGERWYTRTVLKRTLERADAVIAVSDQLAERASALGARSDRTWMIPGGVPYPEPARRSVARAGFGLRQGTLCVLWVGALVPVKQPIDAVATFERFASSRGESDAVLVMIGDGVQAADLRRAVRRSRVGQRVHLLGHRSREEVWRWQCAADVTINTSRSEGTPIAILEALGAGTPAAGYPLPGVAAIIRSLGGGTLAAESTPAALAQAITTELEMKRDRDELARAARERYAMDVVGKEIERVYEAVR